MPQTFRVLQCYSCNTFQVQIVKKINKWTCKICNEKQSIIKVHNEGSAVDCRKLVQKLNMMRKDKDHAQVSMLPHPPEEYATNYSTESGEDSPYVDRSRPATLISEKQGRWTIFAEPKESDSSDQDLEKNEEGDTFTTSREEFEKICRKVRKERSHVRSANSRLTGFHPMSKRRNELSLSKSHSTTSLPTNPSSDDDKLFPYSSIGEDINDMLNDQVAKILPFSKSLHNLDDVYGTYQKIEKDNDMLESSSATQKHHSHVLLNSGKTSNTDEIVTQTATKTSKWTKFMPQTLETDAD